MTCSPHQLLRERYAAPAYAYFEEVGNATGGRANTFADGIAMSLWPSRGLELLGFEVKISRGDLLRELKDPAKNASIQKYCHRWYLVISDKTLIKTGELPPTWGLMAVVSGQLRVVAEAPALTPEPWTPLFFAGLVRSLHQSLAARYVPKAVHTALEARVDTEVDKRVTKAVEAQLTQHTRQLTDKLYWAEHAAKNLREAIENFEVAAGVRISANRWEAKRQGNAFRVAELLMQQDHPATNYTALAAAAQQIADGARQLAAIREAAEAAAMVLPG